MKHLSLVVGLLSVSGLLLIGCPVTSTQTAMRPPELDVESPKELPFDPFVPRSPLDGLQVAEPPKTESKRPVVEPEIPAVEPSPPIVVPKPPVVEPPPPIVEQKPPVVEPPPPIVEQKPPVVEPPPPIVVPKPPAVEPSPPIVEQKPPVVEPPPQFVASEADTTKKPNSESTWTPATQSSSFADVPITTITAEPTPPPQPTAPMSDTVLPNPEDREHRSRIPEEILSPEFFADWPKPKLLLVFTGFINGYVEPCGCAGLDQMKGGLSRRRTFLQELGKKGWPIIPIDAGNLNKGFGLQEELKYNIVVDESLRQMKYEMLGLGNRELLFPTDMLILYSVDVPGSPRRYTSANIQLLNDPDCISPFRTQIMNGVKVGMVSVIGESAFTDINNADVKRFDIVDSIKEILPKLDDEKCDKRVLIVHGSNKEFQATLKAFPNRFDFALCSDGPAEPPASPQWIGSTMNVEVGEKGKYAIAIGLFDDVDHPVRYQRVALDSRFKNSPDVMLAMQFYQDQLKVSGLEGLGIKAIPNRRAAESGVYVGSKACADCHEPSQTVWRKSKHAQAWNTLAETAKPARTSDPECIACHAVGWHPAEFLPYENGFMGEKETPHLIDVGCESCHGPGEKHVAAEKTADDALKARLRKAVRLPLEGNAARKLCIECHDGDNSPHFDFDTYWPKIQHKESTE